MLPGMELMGCTGLAVPPTVMEHVVKVESSFNPYAIGVVGGRLARQPRSLAEALSTARMLEENLTERIAADLAELAARTVNGNVGNGADGQGDPVK